MARRRFSLAMIMKTLTALCLLFAALALRAANISFQNLNPTQLEGRAAAPGYVGITNGAAVTNFNANSLTVTGGATIDTNNVVQQNSGTSSATNGFAPGLNTTWLSVGGSTNYAVDWSKPVTYIAATNVTNNVYFIYPTNIPTFGSPTVSFIFTGNSTNRVLGFNTNYFKGTGYYSTNWTTLGASNGLFGVAFRWLGATNLEEVGISLPAY